MSIELLLTADGSHTLHVPEAGITYHSRYGALRESMHVFIDSGLNYMASKKTQIQIFEMGFGTGLNALLTLIEAENRQLSINYVTVDTNPLLPELVEQLNYSENLGGPEIHKKLVSLHNALPGESCDISPWFKFTKYANSLQDFIPLQKFDIIYYDAFAPNYQPELWTATIFEKIRGMMNKGACLVTYCSKGEVRRAMKAAGLTVTKLKGPPGKFEIVRAFNLNLP